MLTLILGTMRSGKSTELIRRMVQLHQNNSNYIFIRNSIDNRNFIARDITLADGYKIVDETKLFNNYKGYILLIDEVQFLDESLVQRVIELSLDNDVICAGLSSMAGSNKLWDSVATLIPFADSITKLNAMCECCGKIAIIHKHLGGAMVGDNYKVLCLKCFSVENKGVINEFRKNAKD
ncbi:thymidine kinase [Campylobacter sp. MG1]|uniref:thymidine kinase n=1 Tax=Campylobacter sp. MG1 TaxID=2976332 RepID=UPI00226CC517|nr:thymidine kinase [Campylobacter sp. MG1]